MPVKAGDEAPTFAKDHHLDRSGGEWAPHEPAAVILAGVYDGTPDFGLGPLPQGNVDLYMAKLDATGKVIWSKGFAVPVASGVQGLSFDAQDNLVVMGLTGGTLDFGAGPITLPNGGMFLAKFVP